MNKKNTEILINDISKGIKILSPKTNRERTVRFGMSSWERETKCNTACCIGGHITLRIGLDNKCVSLLNNFEGPRSYPASDWLGVTPEQGSQLFFPVDLSDRRASGITKEKDVWGDLPRPINLSGREGRKQAVRALRRALKIWGSDET